uniref:Galanin domain-containing protein n=1 Tax=Labrus bergylta TaxID=56723 RepID=A0A3Q3FBA6_9LABR
MQRCFGFVCVSLIFCAALSETIGLVIAAKEKRGWTLNSAGYLLGPRRIDHLIQIKDSPSARRRDELLAPCKIETNGRCRLLASGEGLLKRPNYFNTLFSLHGVTSGARILIGFLSVLVLKQAGRVQRSAAT